MPASLFNTTINTFPAQLFSPAAWQAAWGALLGTPPPADALPCIDGVLAALSGLPEKLVAVADGSFIFVAPGILADRDLVAPPVAAIVLAAIPAAQGPPPQAAALLVQDPAHPGNVPAVNPVAMVTNPEVSPGLAFPLPKPTIPLPDDESTVLVALRMQFEVLVDAGANAADIVARSDDLLAAMVRWAAEDVCPKAWGYWTTVQGAANQAKILGIS